MKFNRTLKLTVVLLAMFIASTSAKAQESTGNIYSPYSLYGLGVLGQQGSSATQSMGGLSIATKTPFTVNTANPAAYSVATPKTMLFSFGLHGTNEYFNEGDKRTSHNSFNISDLSAQFPIAKKLGAAFSYSPYSTVGYDMSFSDKVPNVNPNIGEVSYNYHGEGGLAMIKGGIGWEVIDGLSIGANLIYYFGDINRTNTASLYSIVTPESSYRSIYTSVNSHMGKMGGEIGFQYDIDLRFNRFITIGAVFTPRINTKFEETEIIDAVNNTEGSYSVISNETTYPSVTIPTKISTGISYRTSKMTVGIDYIYQNWNDAFEIANSDIRLTSLQEVKAGFEYVPNKYDLRSHMKRWTYRAGIRGGSSYLVHNNNKIKELSGSFGVGVPLQRGGASLLNIGLEGGYRGSVGTNSIKEKYLKVNIGISLFTINEWFVRHRFK